ncbi:cytochrome b5-like [Curcuma longa]|uniref:cytochrome b5-like n=1 Tax=Curcuma longa TaxID=136217 RepID=UPI003D9E7F92
MASHGKGVYTLTDVAAHSSRNDCWLVIGGKVYDVTKFLEDHPGGEEVLLASVGKDSTNDFEDIGHTKNARAIMDQYYVGEIDAASIPKKFKYTPPKQPFYNQDKTLQFILKLVQLLIPMTILALALSVRIYTNQ